MHLNTQCALHTILIFLKHFLHIFFWGGGGGERVVLDEGGRGSKCNVAC